MEYTEWAEQYRARAGCWRLHSELARSESARQHYLEIAHLYETIAEDMAFLAKQEHSQKRAHR